MHNRGSLGTNHQLLLCAVTEPANKACCSVPLDFRFLPLTTVHIRHGECSKQVERGWPSLRAIFVSTVCPGHSFSALSLPPRGGGQ